MRRRGVRNGGDEVTYDQPEHRLDDSPMEHAGQPFDSEFIARGVMLGD